MIEISILTSGSGKTVDLLHLPQLPGQAHHADFFTPRPQSGAGVNMSRVDLVQELVSPPLLYRTTTYIRYHKRVPSLFKRRCGKTFLSRPTHNPFLQFCVVSAKSKYCHWYIKKTSSIQEPPTYRGIAYMLAATQDLQHVEYTGASCYPTHARKNEAAQALPYA